MKRIILPVLVISAFGWGLYHMARGSSGTKPAVRHKASSGSAQGHQPHHIGKQRVTLPRRPNIAPERRSADSREQTPPATTNDPTPTLEARRQLVIDAFTNESVDASWAPWASRTLHDKLNGEEGVSSVDVVCHQTMCKLELRFNDTSTVDKLMPRLGMLIPWKTSGVFHVTPDHKRLSLYVSREGESLPRLDS